VDRNIKGLAGFKYEISDLLWEWFLVGVVIVQENTIYVNSETAVPAAVMDQYGKWRWSILP